MAASTVRQGVKYCHHINMRDRSPSPPRSRRSPSPMPRRAGDPTSTLQHLQDSTRSLSSAVKPVLQQFWWAHTDLDRAVRDHTWNRLGLGADRDALHAMWDANVGNTRNEGPFREATLAMHDPWRSTLGDVKPADEKTHWESARDAVLDRPHVTHHLLDHSDPWRPGDPWQPPHTHRSTDFQ